MIKRNKYDGFLTVIVIDPWEERAKKLFVYTIYVYIIRRPTDDERESDTNPETVKRNAHGRLATIGKRSLRRAWAPIFNFLFSKQRTNIRRVLS